MKWIPYLDQRPENGQKVLAIGQKTLCCEEDMDDKVKLYECKFTREICSYRTDDQGIQYDQEYHEEFSLGDEFSDGYLMNVEFWMPWMELVKFDESP